MIKNEKELEDYICNNQQKFIEKLKNIFEYKYIDFVGRRIKIGNDNIADLVYIAKYNDEIPIKDIIIVELKYRELQCKDLSQIARYMSVLEEKDNNLNFENVFGCFVSFGCSNEMKDVCKKENNIKFIKLKCDINFDEENYCYTQEYLGQIKIDDRLKQYMIDE